MRAGARQAAKVGQRVERKIDFPGRATKAEAGDFIEKIPGQLGRIHELPERQMRIDAREHQVRLELVTRGEHDPCGAAFLRENARHGHAGPNLGAGFARGAGNGVRNGARAPRENPHDLKAPSISPM